MSKPRKIDLVIEGLCDRGEILWTNPSVVKTWCEAFSGEKIIVTAKLLGSLNDKARMFAYIHGPLVDTTLAAFEKSGIEGCNTADVFYCMKGIFGKYIWLNPLTGKSEERIYDYSDKSVSVDLLAKFVNDWVLYLEKNMGFIAPDSAAYKTQKKYGQGFKSMKNHQFPHSNEIN